MTSADPATLKVSWQPPLEVNCNGPITGYVIRYARVGSDDNMIVNVPDDTNLAISGLFACVEYSVTMAAVNVNGTGPFSKPVIATSGEDCELNYIVTQLAAYIFLTLKCTVAILIRYSYTTYCKSFEVEKLCGFRGLIHIIMKLFQ